MRVTPSETINQGKGNIPPLFKEGDNPPPHNSNEEEELPIPW